MSYYDYYGAETTDAIATTDAAAPEQEYEMVADPTWVEPPPPVTPVMFLFSLVPVSDLFTYYKLNDAYSGNDSDWKNVANLQLVGGAIKLTIFFIATPFPYVHARFLPIALTSTLQELVALYLINTAEGNNAYADVNMLYGATAWGAVYSAFSTYLEIIKPPLEAPLVRADSLYGDDEPAEDDTADAAAATDSYSGYYGYY